MANYSLTKKAVQDLKQIWNYTYDNWSESQADKYLNQVLKHCSKISKNHQYGRSYEKLYPNLKGSKINKHIVFYREMEKNEIRVERILHERMDLKNKFSQENI